MIKYSIIKNSVVLNTILIFFFLSISYDCSAAKAGGVLSEAERTWLKENPESLRLAVEKDYPPFSFIDNSGAFKGISADYIKLIEKKLAISFSHSEPAGLVEILKKAQEGSIDIITSLKKTTERSVYLNFTDPYITAPVVIITRQDKYKTLTLNRMKDMSAAVSKGYAIHDFLVSQYPDIQLLPVDNDLTVLEKVAFGEVNAAVLDIASASHIITMTGISNLKITGRTEFNYNLSLASRKDLPMLHEILQKGLSLITKQEQREITDRWINLQSSEFLISDRLKNIFIALLGTIIIIITAVILWNSLLRRRVTEQTLALQEELDRRVIAEKALTLHRDQLDEIVIRQTADINLSNRSLKNELIERKRIDHDLKQRERQLSESQKVARLGSWEWHIPTNTITWSDELYNLFGVNPGVFNPTFETFIAMVHPDDQEILHKVVRDSLFEHKDYNLDIRMVRPDNTQWIMEARGTVTYDETGEPVSISGTAQDITERKLAEQQLQESEQRYRHIFENNHAVMLIIDPESADIIDANAAALSFYGYTCETICAMKITDINVLPEDQVLAEIENACMEQRNYFSFRHSLANGDIRDVEVYSGPVYMQNKQMLISIIHDVTERKILEERLQESIIRDELTGLFNRRGFLTLAEQQCKLSDRMGNTLALMYIDLDGFKSINDIYGHKEGDNALIAMAKILRQTFRESDIIARIGGDEFVVLLNEPSAPDSDNVLKKNLLSNTREYNEHSGLNYQILCSLGISHYSPDMPCSIDDLLAKADTLMYRNKRKKKSSSEEDEHVYPTEHRAFRRFKARGNLMASFNHSEQFRVQEISVGGVSIQSPEKLNAGNEYQIRLFQKDGKQTEAACRVVWSSQQNPDDSESGFTAGLEFLHIDIQNRQILEEMVSALL